MNFFFMRLVSFGGKRNIKNTKKIKCMRKSEKVKLCCEASV